MAQGDHLIGITPILISTIIRAPEWVKIITTEMDATGSFRTVDTSIAAGNRSTSPYLRARRVQGDVR